MPIATRGEVWMADLGLVAKARPVLIPSIPFLDHERAVFLVMPHTTALRGTRFETVIDVRWLAKGAFDAQGIRSLPGSVLMRKLGSLNADQMKSIEAAIRKVMGMEPQGQ
jgi:mRNA interferase MazF